MCFKKSPPHRCELLLHALAAVDAEGLNFQLGGGFRQAHDLVGARSANCDSDGGGARLGSLPIFRLDKCIVRFRNAIIVM